MDDSAAPDGLVWARPQLRIIFGLIGAMLGLAIFIAGEALAADAVPAKLSERDRADIVRIENYFNDLKTMTAKFLQVASTGAVASGTMFLSRPGKFRFEYDPPSPDMLIADGTFLIFVDKELRQTTHIFLSSTPVGVLVREVVKLGGDITVTGISRRRGLLRVTIADSDDAEDGTLTLVFSEKPFQLRQWQVLDAQRTVTTVTLNNARTGMALDKKLFEFDEDAPK
ncbi:MAG: outer membrane lipoprotein carrier protein LolA [Rhodospirillaceae bacterium]|jgi:outer membrane lipoprotein-sorting protein|nr:outer membrane lipoprotein carrier protein LolA [Rhodospirillaceae bacterium]MBT3884940.1 outer membrane lipoprotein carrier protein LolA [Rhodospirillaceae bacterium]MBT4118198.1 outer membrane lipoprotein carrier protein LolA [Rhodospirillaceae bacterium]MBT4673041.1 outer membrane lipoprotein carrier protein LolA [Rhodospirillaceae bacterium]MBT4719676.1 outer membrane lipoprotein carrier protein LolA [Rhodospirillaceae bacterium]